MSLHLRRLAWKTLAASLFLLSVGISQAFAQSTYFLWTGQAAAQTQIDVNHTSSWHVIVSGGSTPFGGGNFTMKKGTSSLATVTLRLYRGSNAGGTLLASVTQPASAFTGQFSPVAFVFDSVQTLTAGRYYVTLTSTAVDVQSQAFFIKGVQDAIISSDGTTPIDPGIASASSSPDAANLTLEKLATPGVAAGGMVIYTLRLGNDGGSASGTAATVSDALPSGVTATAVAPGTGVTSVSCTNLNAAGATLTCTVALASLPSASPPAASFTIAATAPAWGGAITNYASVDATGGTNPAAPGPSCTTTSCSSAATAVTGGGSPALTLAKTAAVSTLTRGGSGSFSLTVSNTGSAAADGTTVTVTDTLPPGLRPTAAAGTGWSCAIGGQTVTCTRSEVLAVSGAYPAIGVTVSVATDAAASLTNIATVSGGGDSTEAAGSAAVTTVDPLAASLTLTKSASSSTFTRGGSGAFLLTVRNDGGATTDGTPVTVTDSVPAGLTPTAANGSGWSCGIAGQAVTCSRSDALPAAADYPAITVIVAVAGDAGASLSNTASVSGGGDATPSAGSATISAVDPATPDLTVGKTASAAILIRSGAGTFTLVVANAGTGPTGGVVTVIDTLPSGLTPTAASGAGWSCAIGAQTVTCTRADALAPAGAYPAIAVTATVAANAPPSVTNTATVQGGGDPTAASGSATVATADAGAPSLGVRKTASAGTFTRGGTGSFTLAIGNTGDAATDGTAVTATDTLPAGLVPSAAAGPGWTCGITGQTVSCTRTDVLAAGGSYAAIDITATVSPDAAASLTNTATVSGGGDPTPAGAAVDVQTVDGVNLLVTAIPGAPTFLRGGTGSFVLTVRNSGGIATDGSPVTVMDTLPAGLTPASADGSGWACAVSGQVASCTRSDRLLPGSTYPQIRIGVVVAADAPGSLLNAASVIGGGDPTAASDSASVTTDAVNLAIANVASRTAIVPRAAVTFTLSVTNTGGAATAGAVTVTDLMPDGLTPTAASGDGWSCTVGGQTVTCHRGDVLASGAGYPRIAVSALASDTVTGSLVSVATVAGGGDPTPASAEAIVSCAPATLAITKRAGADVVERGGTVAYVVAVTNGGAGPTDGTPVTVTDPLPAGLQPISAEGPGWSCGISGQTVTCSRSDVLAAGARFADITIAARLAADATGTLTNVASVRGGAASPASSSAAVTAATAADVVLAKVHQGDFVRGDLDARFFLAVSNRGRATATGTTQVSDSVPLPLVPVRAQGDGWSCDIRGQVVTCARNDELAPGASFPPVVLSVFVPQDAPASIVNSASLGGTIVATDRVAVSDPVSIVDPAPVDLEVSKSAERSRLRIGDQATLSLGTANPSRFVIQEVTLRDTLPPGFMYVPGSATLRVTGPSLADLIAGRHEESSGGHGGGFATITTSIEGSVVNGEIVFVVGQLAPGAAAHVEYRAVVAPIARPGRFATHVVGTAVSPVGDTIDAASARVELVVVDDPFSTAQVLIGRVFEDTNRNGTQDTDERGVAGVRVVTATGLSAFTDASGRFSLPSLAAGSVVVAVDPGTIPDGLALADRAGVLGGGGVFLRTPLEGGSLLRQNFALVPGPAARDRFTPAPASGTPTAAAAAKAAPLEIVPSRAGMSAGGADRQVVVVRLTDPGRLAGDPPIRIRTSLGTLTPVSATASSPCGALGPEERPELSREVTVKARDGEAAVCLVASAEPGDAILHATADPDGARSATARVRVDAAGRSPLLVGASELGVGLSAHGKPGADTDARRVDGQVNLFFQGSAASRDLLTVAVRSKGSVNAATGANGLFELDPAALPYPLMGDSSTRLQLAQSSSRVYARYDYGRSYLLYGDLRADSSARGSGLMEFGRHVTGLRGHLENAGASRRVEGQASRPNTAYAREIFNAFGGSLVALARPRLVPGTEVVTLETRDRRNPERVASRDTLLRNVDYTLDVRSGLLQVLRRLPLFDQPLNLVQLIVAYEYETSGLESMAYLGRASIAIDRIGLEIGGSAFVQDSAGTRFGVGGLQLEQRLGNGGVLRVELPVSRGRLPLDVRQSPLVPDAGRDRDGTALRVAVERAFARVLTVRGTHDRTDRGFANPYGVITVPGQTYSSASADVRLTAATRVTMTTQFETNRNARADNDRATVGLRVVQGLGARLTATAGLDERRLDDDRAETVVRSRLASGGLQWKPVARLSTSISREQNLRDADPTYPDQTLLGGQYDLAPGARLFVTQRWSSAPIIPIGGGEAGGLLASPLSTRETSAGVISNLGPYTGVTSRYQLDSTVNGTDSFAVVGVTTRVPLHRTLSIDFSLDNATPLAGTPKGYRGGGVGVGYLRSDVARMTARYEARRRDGTQQSVSIGGVGRLTPNLSLLLNYRLADLPHGTEQHAVEARAAMAVRPRRTDRAALLFSAERIDAGAYRLEAGRTDRVSADGYLQLAPRLESYTRVALFRTPGPTGGFETARYLQTRLQHAVTRLFDVAVEGRRVQVTGDAVNIAAFELGTRLGGQLRVGVGYSTDGFANPGSLLHSTASRGGPYLVFTTTLAAMFDLMASAR